MICLFALLVSAVAPLRAAEGNETKLEKEAVFVEMMFGHWENMRHGCMQALPEEARAIAAIVVRWRQSNRAEIFGSRAYAKSRGREPMTVADVVAQIDPNSAQTQAKKVRESLQDFCHRVFGRMAKGGLDFAGDFPETSKLMRDFAASHPFSRDELRAYDNPMGCLTALVNADFKMGATTISYERGVRMCQCMYDGANAVATPAQWAQYEDLLGSAPEKARALPHVKRMAEAAQACVAKHATG